MPAQRKTNQSRGLTAAGLIAVTAATLLMMAWAIFPTAALADQQISVNQGSLSNHQCNADEWHFVITQIDDESNAPATIQVTWANGASANLSLANFTGGVAHYFSFENLNSTVTAATATIYSGWSGTFNLSHGPCSTTTPGSITVVKQTNPDGSAQKFEFDTDYGSNFSLADGEQNDSGNLVPGTYSVAEVNIPAGWSLTSATCSDQSNPNSINLAAGEHVTCTFTNTQEETPPPTPGSITVVKQTNPDGSAQKFEFDTDYGSNFSLADGEQNDSGNLVPGTYSVAEVNIPAGWSLTSATCSDQSNPNSINLAAGEHVTCTFTNTQNATTTTPGGGGGGGTTTTPPPAPTTTTTTPPIVAPTTIHNTSTTPAAEVLPTTVRPGKLAFTGIEDVVPIGALALTLMTTGSGLLWAGSRRRRHDGSEDED